jgi:hypothetical protein
MQPSIGDLSEKGRRYHVAKPHPLDSVSDKLKLDPPLFVLTSIVPLLYFTYCYLFIR